MKGLLRVILAAVALLGALPSSRADVPVQHLIYTHLLGTKDYLLMDLRSDPNLGWRSTILPTAAYADPATQLAAYVLGDTQRVIYQDVNGAVHELLGDTTGKWTDINLTQQAGPGVLSPPSGRALAGYAVNIAQPGGPPNIIDHVAYVGIDNHVHELAGSNNTWHDADLMPGSRVVVAGNSLAAYLVNNVPFIAYLDMNGHVHGLSPDPAGSIWRDNDLTQATCLPPATTCAPPAMKGSALAGHFFIGSLAIAEPCHVTYIGIDGHLYDLYSQVNSSGSSWVYKDLTGLPDAKPPAAGSGLNDFIYVWRVGGEEGLLAHYVGIDNHLHEVGRIADWEDQDLSQWVTKPSHPPDAMSNSALAGYELPPPQERTSGIRVIFYLTDDGGSNRPHLIAIFGDQFEYHDLSAEASAEPAPGSHLAAYTVPSFP